MPQLYEFPSFISLFHNFSCTKIALLEFAQQETLN